MTAFGLALMLWPVALGLAALLWIIFIIKRGERRYRNRKG